MSAERISVVILAGGKGRRLGCSEIPKPMVCLGGKPLIEHTLKTLSLTTLPHPVIVIGFQGEKIVESVGGGATYVRQVVLDGTAGALEAGLTELKSNVTDVLVLQGDDSAGFRPETILDLIRQHERSRAAITMLITNQYFPDTHKGQYVVVNGRVVARVSGSQFDPRNGGFSAGLFCFQRLFLDQFLPKVPTDSTDERGIPHLVEQAIAAGELVIASILEDPRESVSVNTPAELAAAGNLRI